MAAENGYLKAYRLIIENSTTVGCTTCESISEIIKGKIPTDEAYSSFILKRFYEKNIYDWTPLHFVSAIRHVKGCKIVTDYITKKDPWGLSSLSPMVKRSLDKAESIATAVATNPEQPAKGQLISKAIYSVLDSPKKRTKKI